MVDDTPGAPGPPATLVGCTGMLKFGNGGDVVVEAVVLVVVEVTRLVVVVVTDEDRCESGSVAVAVAGEETFGFEVRIWCLTTVVTVGGDLGSDIGDVTTVDEEMFNIDVVV
jgi:hypothetical protein